MKHYIYAVLTIASILFVSSCTSSDDQISHTNSTNELVLKFDNIFNNADIITGLPYTTSNNDQVTFDRINYIISNVVLIKNDGSEVVLPKAESFFIVQEINNQVYSINLPNVPTGSYKALRFGLGVDEAQFLLGASGQGDFLTLANSLDMLWSWSAGYKFLAVEGTYQNQINATQSSYKIHTGKTGLAYNYATIQLNFPSEALVRKDFAPSVHIMADISKIFESLVLSEQDQIMGGEKLGVITANASNMFTVHHIHNF